MNCPSFAVCNHPGTRRTAPVVSCATSQTHGEMPLFCRECTTGHTAKLKSLPCVGSQTHDENENFAVCRISGTRQNMETTPCVAHGKSNENGGSAVCPVVGYSSMPCVRKTHGGNFAVWPDAMLTAKTASPSGVVGSLPCATHGVHFAVSFSSLCRVVLAHGEEHVCRSVVIFMTKKNMGKKQALTLPKRPTQ